MAKDHAAEVFARNKDGSPNFGVPFKEGEILKVPLVIEKLGYKKLKVAVRIIDYMATIIS